MKVARCHLSEGFPNGGSLILTARNFKGINIDVLQSLSEKQNITVITPEILVKSGYTSKNDHVKILGRGELKAKLEVTAHAFSASAKKAIEELGGLANTI